MGPLQLRSHKNDGVLELMFVKVAGSCQNAPCVEMFITNAIGKRSPKFIARIDTGADISCIPKEVFRHIMPCMWGIPVLIRDREGDAKRERTFRITLNILDGVQTYKRISPPRGVLIREGTTGLLGMDIILPYFRLEGESNIWRLIPR